METIAKSEPDSVGLRNRLLTSHVRIADTLAAQGDWDGALAEYARAREIAQAAIDKSEELGAWQKRLVTTDIKIADALVGKGSTADALARYQQADTLLQKLIGNDPSNPDLQRELQYIEDKLQKLAAKN